MFEVETGKLLYIVWPYGDSFVGLDPSKPCYWGASEAAKVKEGLIKEYEALDYYVSNYRDGLGK
ncbi:hypothetical protein J7K97_00545 [Candidatus Aerophobetes bacterium]|nr:hypothetical protein [Candidatus Aerophobetes bacterium]